MQKVFLESLHVPMGVSKAFVTHLAKQESLQRPALSITLWYNLSTYTLVHCFIQIIFNTLSFLFYLYIYTYLHLLLCEEITWVISMVNIVHVFHLFLSLSLKHLYFSFYSRQSMLFNLWLFQNGIMSEYMHFLFGLLQTNKPTNKLGLYFVSGIFSSHNQVMKKQIKNMLNYVYFSADNKRWYSMYIFLLLSSSSVMAGIYFI